MVAVEKKNNKIRICLDPRDLNRISMRCHYPMPTIEQIATCLNKANMFTDAKAGFWQVKLHQQSSYRTNLNTPFMRYQWLGMLFGISSVQ